MSILIKGVDMPKSCCYCVFCDIVLGKEPFCALTTKSGGIAFNPYKEKMKDCPLVEIPKHGRLIDAEHLSRMWFITSLDDEDAKEWVQAFQDSIKFSKTVIDAEE